MIRFKVIYGIDRFVYKLLEDMTKTDIRKWASVQTKGDMIYGTDLLRILDEIDSDKNKALLYAKHKKEEVRRYCELVLRGE